MTAPRSIDPDIVAMLRNALTHAELGLIDEFFILVKHKDEVAYDYRVHDVEDLLYDLGTIILTERIK